MIELYFLFYRLPKQMSQLAKERGRSAVGWSALAIGAWIGAEFFVAFAIGLIHGIGIIAWRWPREIPGLTLLTYVAALIAAILSATLVSRILRSRPMPDSYPVPPPPPAFPGANPYT